MKRHKTLIPLSQFHRRALIVALLCKQNGPQLKGYPDEILEKIVYVQDFFYNELSPHFQLHVEELFPLAKGADKLMDGILHDLTEQFKTLGILVKHLSEGGDLDSQLDVFGAVLEAHVRKTERQFFQHFQEVVDETDLAVIAPRIKERTKSYAFVNDNVHYN